MYFVCIESTSQYSDLPAALIYKNRSDHDGGAAVSRSANVDSCIAHIEAQI